MVGAKTFSTVSEWSVQTCPQQLILPLKLSILNLNQITDLTKKAKLTSKCIDLLSYVLLQQGKQICH